MRTWLARARGALRSALTPPPPPGRLEQLEQRLSVAGTMAWGDRALADLLSAVADARHEAGQLDGARGAYERARALYQASGGPGWVVTRLDERLDELRPEPAGGGPYRAEASPVVWVRHGGRWQRFGRRVVVLGRGSPGLTDVCLPSSAVTRVHAVITHEQGRYVLRDLRTTNGTYLVRRIDSVAVIRRLTTEHVLGDGDELRMGDQSVVVALSDPARAP